VGDARATATTLLRVGVTKVLRTDDWRHLPMVAAAEAIDATQWRVQLATGSAIDTFAAAVVTAGFGLVSLGADSVPLESTFLAIAASDARGAAA